ncbi:MAG: excinuclease ABC subunit UvrC [Candidatus Micrarchaeota archaeon]|nr:excinuclease ABC subunit UvrC [Candidatus Micrarchaeota archaeon]
MEDELKIKIKNLPKESGVYIFKNKDNEVIYVGKAKNIKKRVLSYFSKEQSGKTLVLVKNIADIESIITNNEYEALLLESNLIKKYYPKYNVHLKDASKERYVVITNEDYPRLLILRKNRVGRIKKISGKIYGPFLFGDPKALFIKTLRKIFKIRICNTMPKKVCLQYYLGNCDGPCEGKITKEEYQKNVEKLKEILEDENKIVEYIEEMKNKMIEEAKQQNFEKAIIIRDSITSLENLISRQNIEKTAAANEDYIVIVQDGKKIYAQIWRMIRGVISQREKFSFEIMEEDGGEEFIKRYYQNNFIPNKIFINKLPKSKKLLEKYLSQLSKKEVRIVDGIKSKNKNLIELILKNINIEKAKGGIDLAVIELKEALKLNNYPINIECFDISNLGKEAIVGSMVRFENAKPKQEEYRRFKIKTTEIQNDFQSIKEIVFRRYFKLKLEKKPYPDLVLIDGGINQLRAAQQALEELGIELELFSFEKQNELIYSTKNLQPIDIHTFKEAFLLIKHLIKEAHRFALEYNKKLRKSI